MLFVRGVVPAPEIQVLKFSKVQQSALEPRNPDSWPRESQNVAVEGISAIIYSYIPILQIRKQRLRELTRVLGQVSGKAGLDSKLPNVSFFLSTSISLHTILSWLLTHPAYL